MGTYFRTCEFKANMTTFHYLNPDHNATFRIPGQTELGNVFIFEGSFVQGANGFSIKFHEDEAGVGRPLFLYDVDLPCGDIEISSEFAETIVQHDLFEEENPFIIKITTLHNCYEVTVDDQESPTRLKVRDGSAITLPRYVTIKGDIQIRSFHIKKNSIEKEVYYMSVPGGAKIGDIFTFYGRAPSLADAKTGFRTLLYEFVGQNEDIMFHLNPRFAYHIEYSKYNGNKEQTEIVRNSYINKQFGEEEKGVGNLYYLGAPYKLDVLVEKEHFRCWIDDVEFCTYKHRLPFNGITNIKITYKHSTLTEIVSVVMNRVSCRTPQCCDYRCLLDIERVAPDSVSYFPKIPVNMTIPRRLSDGNCISISGVFKKAHRFKCELKNSNKDTILQMLTDFDRKAVKLCGKNEKPLDITFPFHANGYFHMQIFFMKENNLVLTVDEMPLAIYKPNSDYATASLLYVTGDVRIGHVAIFNT